MKRIYQSLMAAGVVMGLATSSPVCAHAIWFAERSSRLALIYGMGADDLDTAIRKPLIQAVGGYDADWKAVSTELQQDGPLMVVHSAAQTVVVTATFDNGTWSKPPGDGEWEKKDRLQMPGAVVSEKNFKYAVYVNGALHSQMPAFTDQVLQIIPLAASMPSQKGAPLRLRVVFRGKPIAGVRIIPDFVNDIDGKSFKTDRDGIVTIAVRNEGLNVINATYDGPADDPKKVDRIEYEATLSFVLPHKPE